MIGLLAPLVGATVKTMCMSMLSEKLLQQVILILLRRHAIGYPRMASIMVYSPTI